jgi:hypothetical protein
MTILEKDNNIIIKLPNDLIEDGINSLKNKLENYNFKGKIETFKSKKKQIIIDPSNVNNIDFFGYQHIYGFCYFIKKKLEFDNLTVEKKSDSFINFEKKYGLNI